jgi:hypothetical protein
MSRIDVKPCAALASIGQPAMESKPLVDATKRVTANAAANSTASAKKPQRYPATDARRAYQRDLMRKRRAAAKAESGSAGSATGPQSQISSADSSVLCALQVETRLSNISRSAADLFPCRYPKPMYRA